MIGEKMNLEYCDKWCSSQEEWYFKKKGILCDILEKRVLLNDLDIQKDDIVMDVGCGAGRFTIELATRCEKVYAMDISSEQIEGLNIKLKQKGIDNVETFVAPIQKLPLIEKVDKILCLGVIMCVLKSEVLETLKSFYDQLGEGGWALLISTYNYDALIRGNLKREGKFSDASYYFYSKAELIDLFKKAHFEDIATKFITNFRFYKLFNYFNLYKTLGGVVDFDLFVSKFKISKYFSNFLICRGFKK